MEDTLSPVFIFHLSIFWNIIVSVHQIGCKSCIKFTFVKDTYIY